MKREVKVDAVDVTLNLFILDSSVNNGSGKTGLVFNTAGLKLYYVRPRSAAVVINLATQTVTGAHSDGGFVEISAANMPGWYRLDVPDAPWASGVQTVGFHLWGASGMAMLPFEVQLRDSAPTSELQSIADALLLRDFSQVESGGANGSPPYRNLLDACRLLRNKRSISAGTLTVTKEDDAASAWTAAVVTSAGNPISSIDPA